MCLQLHSTVLQVINFCEGGGLISFYWLRGTGLLHDLINFEGGCEFGINLCSKILCCVYMEIYGLYGPLTAV